MPKILIVDDDEDILQVVKLLLSPNGYDVETLSNPEEILDHIKSFNPELIMLDVNIGLMMEE